MSLIHSKESKLKYYPFEKLNMSKLVDLLISESKHGSYQTLPPELITKIPNLKKYSFSKRFDKQRYDWFSKTIDFRNKKVLDIGANVGYFSFCLNHDYNCENYAYEINKKHVEAISLIKEELDIYDERFRCVNQGVTLNEISNLPDVDIILLFNVLHHAGDDFAKEEVLDINKWKQYAINYLKALSEKSKYLVYQAGRSWMGKAQYFCEETEVVNYQKNILAEAGWEIVEIGVVKNRKNINYVNYNSIKKYPSIKDYSWLTKGLAHYTNVKLNDYNFLIRPIFICQKKA